VRTLLALRALAAVLAVGLMGGCEQEPRRGGDLEEILASGELRVIVRPGFLSSPVHRHGWVDERALFRQLTSRLGVRLRWIEARRHDQVLDWLSTGRGDIASSRFSPAAVRDEDLAFTVAVEWLDDLVVTGADAPVISRDDLTRVPLHLHASRQAWLLRAAGEGFDGPLTTVPIPEEVPLEVVVRRVGMGRYPVTIVDSGILEAIGGSNNVRVVALWSERRPLVWAVRRESQRLLAATDDFLFAEQVLARASDTAACRDLTEIRKAGVLRLVTRNSPITCTMQRGGLEGFEYELARDFARRHGLRLELAIPPPGHDPLEWLEQGYGDLAALHEPVDPEDAGRFRVSSPYRFVDLVSVVPGRRDPPASVEDLAGVAFAAAPSVAALCSLLPLEPPLQPSELGPGADSLTALLEVSKGNVDVAIVDEDTARLELPNRSELQLGTVVVPDVPLVWIVNASAPELQAAVDDHLRAVRASALVRELEPSPSGDRRRDDPPRLAAAAPGALSPYDALLHTAGRKYVIDWRLLASLMYEESRFDPTAVGPGGAAGLFQLMPSTWRELGVEDPHDPAAAVEAAASYVARLADMFPESPVADRLALALAAYNVGVGHVLDARRLAREMGLDANRWSGGVETAMLILDEAEVGRQYPTGVCRCRRAVSYTRRVLRRYLVYIEQFPPY